MTFLSLISLICLSSLRLYAIITNGVKQASKTYAPYCLDYGQIAQKRIVKNNKWHLIQGNQSSQNGEVQERVLHVYAPNNKKRLVFDSDRISRYESIHSPKFFPRARDSDHGVSESTWSCQAAKVFTECRTQLNKLKQ